MAFSVVTNASSLQATIGIMPLPTLSLSFELKSPQKLKAKLKYDGLAYVRLQRKPLMDG
jgi:hypothetical protein